MTFLPPGHSSLSPYLIVADAEAVIDWVTATFDAKALRRHEREDGSVMHAELRIGDSVLMLGQATDGWPPVPCHLHVYVPDVDAVYARALEQGAESVQAPTKGDDPDRRGGVKGPGDNTWWIATQVG